MAAKDLIATGLLRACLLAAVLASATASSDFAASSVAHAAASQPPPMAPLPAASPARKLTIRYRAHDGRARDAVVLLPHDYRAGDASPLPLVISPHGRGLNGELNARLWGDLPTIGNFAVVNPDGEGRRLATYSWGASGQISDLARMPAIVEAKLPWVRIDHRRIYAVGGSMGGQETLLLLGR